MTDEELVSCLEALLFASGKPVDSKTLQNILEINNDKLKEIALVLQNKLIDSNSGIQLIEINDGYQLATLEKFYEKVCTLLDTRPKPSLSQAAMEVLAIMAYNPKITRAEIEKIRGVSSDSALNKLLEYGLVEEAGRIDAPGRPMSFKTSDEFLRLFGYKSLQDMPELPRIAEEDPQIQIEGMDEEKEESVDEENQTNETVKQEPVAEESVEENIEEVPTEEAKDSNQQ
ncbi:MAG: SMC-Scp complex subunit ScpB [Clostridia bacterium]|nr:SMC-Scp complex subunit ScpB [Clostridia bacterium]